jgi:hypothetical protein
VGYAESKPAYLPESNCDGHDSDRKTRVFVAVLNTEGRDVDCGRVGKNAQNLLCAAFRFRLRTLRTLLPLCSDPSHPSQTMVSIRPQMLNMVLTSMVVQVQCFEAISGRGQVNFDCRIDARELPISGIRSPISDRSGFTRLTRLRSHFPRLLSVTTSQRSRLGERMFRLASILRSLIEPAGAQRKCF